MKKYASLAIVAAAALGLSACGHSDDASEAAAEDTVEMPADELPTVEPSAPAAPMAAPEADASSAADSEANAARDAANNAAAVAAAVQAADAEGGEQKPAQ